VYIKDLDWISEKTYNIEKEKCLNKSRAAVIFFETTSAADPIK
jgi:hypothetical protein